MTKTFKTCAIFCFTTLWLVIMRIIVSAINLSDNVADWVFSFCVQVIGLGAIPMLLYKFWVKEDVKTGFFFNVKINPLIYLIAVGVGLSLHFLIRSVSVLWQSVAIMMGYTPSNSVGTIYSGPEVLIMSLLCTAVLPAIFEETTYRGLGMQMLSAVKDEKTVILIMGLLFGLGHQFILQTGYAFVAGMAFAYFAIKTKSIIPGMIIHFINNGLSVISEYSEQRQNAYYAMETSINNVLFRSYGTVILTLVVSAAVTVGLLYAAKNLTKKSRVEENAEEGTYFYPNTTQYIDDLFGKSLRAEVKVRPESVAWYEYAFLYGAIAIMTLTTVFTFVWGVMQ